jgi:hypothetical protein
MSFPLGVYFGPYVEIDVHSFIHAYVGFDNTLLIKRTEGQTESLHP